MLVAALSLQLVQTALAAASLFQQPAVEYPSLGLRQRTVPTRAERRALAELGRRSVMDRGGTFERGPHLLPRDPNEGEVELAKKVGNEASDLVHQHPHEVPWHRTAHGKKTIKALVGAGVGAGVVGTGLGVGLGVGLPQHKKKQADAAAAKKQADDAAAKKQADDAAAKKQRQDEADRASEAAAAEQERNTPPELKRQQAAWGGLSPDQREAMASTDPCGHGSDSMHQILIYNPCEGWDYTDGKWVNIDPAKANPHAVG